MQNIDLTMVPTELLEHAWHSQAIRDTLRFHDNFHDEVQAQVTLGPWVTAIAWELNLIFTDFNATGDSLAAARGRSDNIWSDLLAVRTLGRKLSIWTPGMEWMYNRAGRGHSDIAELCEYSSRLYQEFRHNIVLDEEYQTCIRVEDEGLYLVEDVYDLDYLEANARSKD